MRAERKAARSGILPWSSRRAYVGIGRNSVERSAIRCGIAGAEARCAGGRMIENKATARTVSDLMLDIGKRLDDSVALVQRDSPSREFQAYRTAVGLIMGEILLDVLNPLY